jgi:mono/diheme cytochrome c family protein
MRRRLALAGIAVAAAGLGGCGLIDPGTDLVNGKELYLQNCARCHILERAGGGAPIGPNLDDAFARARQDGFGESTFEGIVRAQIDSPARSPSRDPQTGDSLEPMPADLVTGADADDVAAYVASAAAQRGEDPGRLADVGAQAAGTA